jgi:hypothetical protein
MSAWLMRADCVMLDPLVGGRELVWNGVPEQRIHAHRNGSPQLHAARLPLARQLPDPLRHHEGRTIAMLAQDRHAMPQISSSRVMPL